MASVEKKIYSIEIEGVQKFEQQLDRVGQSFNEAEKGAVDLRKELKETLKALRDPNLDQGSKKFKELTERAGQLKDEIGDVNARVKALASDTKQLDGFIDIASGITAGFGLAQGTLALFGAENKKLEETLLKVQSSIAILNSLQAIQNLLQKESAANLLITNALEKSSFVQRVAGNAQLLIENGLKSTNVVVTTAASVAQRALNAAMSANPILLLVSALGGLIAIYEIFINKGEEATQTINNQAKAQEELNRQTKFGIELEKSRNKGVEDNIRLGLQKNILLSELAENEKDIIENTIDLIKYDIARNEEAQKANKQLLNETIPATKKYFEILNQGKKLQLEEIELKIRLRDEERKLNQERETTVKKIQSQGIETQITTEKEKRRLVEIKQDTKSVSEAVNDEYIKIKKNQEEVRQKTIATIQAISNLSQVTANVVIQQAQIASENQIRLYQNQLAELDNNSKEISDKLQQLKTQTDEIEEALSTARGRRRERLIADLKAQGKAEDDLAKKQKKIELEKAEIQKKISIERIKQQKLEIQINAASTTVNTGAAIAVAALNGAKNDPTGGIITAINISALSIALLGAIANAAAKTKQLNNELSGFADGGYTSRRGNVDRTGHRVAGVVHSNEYVVPQRVLANPKGQRMVAQLDKMRKGFADGGFTTPNFQSIQEATTPNIDTRPIYVAVTDINLANERLNKIKSATVI